MKKQKFSICYYVFKFYNLKWVILSKTMYNEQIKTTAVLKILVFWSNMLILYIIWYSKNDLISNSLSISTTLLPKF